LLQADVRVDPSAKFNGAIRDACRYQRLETVKLLLTDVRVDPSDRSNDALRAACSVNAVEVIKVLLQDKRVNPGDCPSVIEDALKLADVGLLRCSLADDRVVSRSDLLCSEWVIYPLAAKYSVDD
jgi:hypothetical protein